MTRYSAAAVVHAAKVTHRQLDFWVRSGWVVATVQARGSGRWREFTLDDIVDVAAMGRLVAAGVAPDLARRVLGERTRHTRGALRIGGAVTITVDLQRVLLDVLQALGALQDTREAPEVPPAIAAAGLGIYNPEGLGL